MEVTMKTILKEYPNEVHEPRFLQEVVRDPDFRMDLALHLAAGLIHLAVIARLTGGPPYQCGRQKPKLTSGFIRYSTI